MCCMVNFRHTYNNGFTQGFIVTMKTRKYEADDIQVLSDIEHVRLRTNVYLGNTNSTQYEIPSFLNGNFSINTVEFIPAVYKAVNEIIDNSIDEFAQIDIPNKHLVIEATPVLGSYTISDNGRGIPIDKHSSGKHTPEIALGSLRSGRNFSGSRDVGVIGMNGVGSACTNYCSVEFSVDVQRDGKRYRQTFSGGATQVSKPNIKTTHSNKTGTSVSFQLDGSVFQDVSLPEELMENRALEIALTNPGVTCEYNGKKFKFKKGFDDVVRKISSKYFNFEADGIEFYVIFDVHDGIDEKIYSWVNSSLLFDGGICNTQFLNAFYDKTTRHLTAAAKKQKCEVTKNDVRKNLLVLGNMRISNPEYDAQSKTRLTGPNLRKEFADLIDQQWSSFSRKNKDWLNEVLERAIVRHHSNANTKAVKEHQKNLKKKVPGLVDATSKHRFECQLLITEGLSAAASITEARDPKTTASLPLTGKINNVHGATVAQVLNMGKITDLLTAIGLIPGQKAVRSTLRYGQIIIATDADYDGGDIFTLLINLFYTYWPELFDSGYEPIIYRLVAPNVCAVKGNKRVHFATRDQYERVKEKYKGWAISYYKGLGSMVKADWDMILSGETDTLIPITNDGEMKETLSLLFGPDANARKDWLQTK
jgi:DNA gyrase/topoisomerase IV subunit B